MKIVCDEKIPFLSGVFEPHAEVVYAPGDRIDAALVRDADALIIRTRTCCNAELLDSSRIRSIASATIGFDHLDTEYLDRRGIKWSNAPGCNSRAVEQYLASAIVNLADKHRFAPRSKTLGVVGVGHVGSRVRELAQALDMDVLLNDPPRNVVESARDFIQLDELLSRADIVTMHVPLTRAGRFRTFHLADDGFFARMKPGAFFINTSRGEVCDTGALKRALKSGKLAGAVLDVWENEPDIDLELLDLVDFGTMHIAGYSLDGKAEGTAQAVRFIAEQLNIGALEDFAVTSLPVPEAPLIRLPADADDTAKINLAVRSCYDLAADCHRLRQAPQNFEKLRNEYEFRREFSAYDATGGGEALHMTLARMGFAVNGF